MEILFESIVCENTSEEKTAVSFCIVGHGGSYTVKIEEKNLNGQLSELLTGRRIRAAFTSGEMQLDIWRGVNGKYRIVYMNKAETLIDAAIAEQQIKMLYMYLVNAPLV